MKVNLKILGDGRMSVSLCENDNSFIATRELSCSEVVDLMARWALRFIPSTGGRQIVLSGNIEDVLVTLKKAIKEDNIKKEL